MMKLSLCILALAASTGNAFSPAPLKTAPRLATKAFMIDPADVHHLVTGYTDVVHVTLLECDNNECVTATGVKAGNMWEIKGGLETEAETTVKVLSIMLDDCE